MLKDDDVILDDDGSMPLFVNMKNSGGDGESNDSLHENKM